MRPSRKSALLAACLFCAASAQEAGALVCPRSDGYYVERQGAIHYFSWKTLNRVPVIGADLASFRSLERPDPNLHRDCGRGGYAGDKYSVYYQGVRIPGAEVASFKGFQDGYASDNTWWYGAGKPIATRRGGELLILGRHEAAYAIHPEGAFYGARRLEREGFQVLGSFGYAKSKNRAYFRGQEIPGIDADSFQVLPATPSVAKDKHTVVIDGRVQERMDGASLQALGGPGEITRDKDRVYAGSAAIEGADPASFTPIGAGYSRDRSAVYLVNRVISGADPASFRLLDTRTAVDKHQVYRDGKPIAGADPASFRLLGHGYARDVRAVYYLDRRVESADLQSFTMVRAAGRARDRSYGYEYGKAVCSWTDSPGLPACDARQYVTR